MKTFMLFALLAIVALPMRDAFKVKNPSLSLMEGGKAPRSDDDDDDDNSYSSFTAIILTETGLYEKYVCIGNPDGLRLIVPGNCTAYYECFNSQASVNSCGYLTPYYDPVNQTCVEESACIERNIEVPTGPVGCLGVCCGKPTGLYADPQEKTQFYFCQNNTGILHSCCGGEQFNPITKACDIPANCP